MPNYSDTRDSKLAYIVYLNSLCLMELYFGLIPQGKRRVFLAQNNAIKITCQINIGLNAERYSRN